LGDTLISGYKKHRFMPGETVRAIIRKYNGYVAQGVDLDELSQDFLDVNGVQVYKPGMNVKIPLLEEFGDKADA